MPMPVRDDGFRCEVHPDRDVVALRPVGEIDIATAGCVDAALEDLLVAGFRELVLDLRDVTFLDSSGIRLMVGWARRADADGFRFAYAPGPEAVRQVLRLTGVDGFVAVAESRGDRVRA
jgi:anti-sigma B factor antagonist